MWSAANTSAGCPYSNRLESQQTKTRPTMAQCQVEQNNHLNNKQPHKPTYGQERKHVTGLQHSFAIAVPAADCANPLLER
jgi:hypothetical protein